MCRLYRLADNVEVSDERNDFALSILPHSRIYVSFVYGTYMDLLICLSVKSDDENLISYV